MGIRQKFELQINTAVQSLCEDVGSIYVRCRQRKAQGAVSFVCLWRCCQKTKVWLPAVRLKRIWQMERRSGRFSSNHAG